MSTAAILVVKDEEDVIEAVCRHLAANVDEIHVWDNGSTDGTGELLSELADELPLTPYGDDEVGYWQSRKMTEHAQEMLARGHQWVIPADADEIWYAPGGRRLADYLGGLAPDAHIVKAELYNHLPTAEDAEREPNPFRRIGWRQRQHGALPKVACRLHRSLVIHAGNHGASYQGTALAVGGLTVRHFSWRTPEQYLRKIRSGQRAYEATDLSESIGAHWRMWAGQPDEAVLDHFRRWFYSERPREDDSLIYDPAPLGRRLHDPRRAADLPGGRAGPHR